MGGGGTPAGSDRDPLLSVKGVLITLDDREQLGLFKHAAVWQTCLGRHLNLVQPRQRPDNVADAEGGDQNPRDEQQFLPHGDAVIDKTSDRLQTEWIFSSSIGWPMLYAHQMGRTSGAGPYRIWC